jgi:uncharacterized protein YyaL (SSP411 family)
MFGRHHRAIALLVVLACCTASPIMTFAQQAGEKPKGAKKPDIYDTKANPRDQIQAALTKARRDHTRVLVMYGGNWCGWCHKLHETFQKDAAIKRTLLYEYALVLIDSQHPDVAAITEKYGAKINGVPYLTVLDEDGKVICNQETGTLEEGDHHDVKKVEAFLAEHAAPPVDAEMAVSDALAKASAERKSVLLHFGAPWCGWCHRLEDFLARDDVRQIMEQDFVDLKVDVDRMTHAEEVQKRFHKPAQGGIPWIAFLDPTGKVLATSDGPKGNIGYPAAPDEIEHFMGMLETATKRMTTAQKAEVRGALEEAGRKLRTPPAAAVAN